MGVVTNTILVDDRENRPYSFPNWETEEARLGVGDYTLNGYENEFAIERKTLDDLATSMGSERLRFENEIRRANGYANVNDDGNPLPGTKPEQSLREFIVLIEAPKKDVYGYRNQAYCDSYYSNIHPNSIIGTVEKWPQKYDKLDFVWAGNRSQARSRVPQILTEWRDSY